LKSVNNVTFINGDICNTIYLATGSSVDWTYNVANVTYSYAVELRGSFFTGGFVLPPDEIVPSGKEVLAAVVALWEYAAQKLNIEPVTKPTKPTGTDGGSYPAPTGTAAPPCRKQKAFKDTLYI
jgi:hypothetical protein